MPSIETGAQEFSKEELEAIKAELEEMLRPPEVKPICREMDIRSSGTKLIKPMLTAHREYPYAAAISVYSLRFHPDSSENLDLLRRHVTMAVESLANVSPEFASPEDLASFDTAYKRPKKLVRNLKTGEQEDFVYEDFVYNAYVFPEDGEVIVREPLILSDVIHVYNALQGVIIPKRETLTQIANAIESARWLEVRGPILSTDDRNHWSRSSYGYAEVLPEYRLGCLHGVDDKDVVATAKEHAALLRVAGLSTDDELIGQMIGLAIATSTGLLEDGSGRYLPLSAPDAGKSLAEIQQEQADLVLNRAQDMLQDVLEQVGQSAGADPKKAFHRAESIAGARVHEALEQQRHDDADEYMRAYNEAHAEPRRPSLLSKQGQREQNIAQALSDLISGKKYVEREVPGSFLATQSNVGFVGPEVPFFLPRVYKVETWRGMREYRSRPSGYVYSPIISLPENLEPFVDRRNAAHTYALTRKLLNSPQAG